jgi:archaemetzincin
MNILYLIFSLFVSTETKPPPPLKIAVLYYTPIDKNLRAELIQNLNATYNCSVTEIKGIATPPSAAICKPRNRYSANVLLTNLNTYNGYDKVIGIMAKDICTPRNGVVDWGIMGLANTSGKSCVISTFRIKTANKVLFNDRFIKVALHEMGHAIGLPHCSFSRTCFMEAAQGTIKTVDGESRFLCSNCKKLIKQYIK